VKRIVWFFMSTLTAVVLLFGYHTSTSSKAAGGQTSIIASMQSAPSSVPATAAPSTSAASPSPSASSSASASKTTVTGDVAQTRWGPVQVQVTVQGGKIADVSVVQYPDGNDRDQEINATALPILVQETISTQNANIDMVSGATVTSEGYLTSLQSALDQAGL
jgi:uncharacterized protein with FMN-binding domain